MRKIFVGIPVNQNLSNELSRVTSQFTQPFLKWTKEENLHITLCFIGFIEDERLSQINMVLEKLTFKQFNLKIKGVEPIKRKGRIDMIWVTFEPNTEYDYLSNKIHELLDIPIIRNPLPHITLCRVKYQAKDLFPQEKMELKPNLVVEADKIILYESKSIGNGATYLPLTIIYPIYIDDMCWTCEKNKGLDTSGLKR